MMVRKSVIDLIFVSSFLLPIANSSTDFNNFFSDHFPITVTLNQCWDLLATFDQIS